MAKVGGKPSYAPSVSCVANGEGCFRVFFRAGLFVFGSSDCGERTLKEGSAGTHPNQSLRAGMPSGGCTNGDLWRKRS